MTSVRIDLDPKEDDRHTYPTLVNGRIMEMTGSQRRRLVERNLTIEQRVLRIERVLARMGVTLDDVYY